MVDSLEGLRAGVWRALCQTSLGSRAHQDPSLRLPLAFALHAVVALALTLAAPLPLMLLAPLLFGVPHVLTDLRLLVLRGPPGLWRQGGWWVGGGLVAMTGLRVAAILGLGRWPRAELGCGLACLVGAAWLGAGRRRWAALLGVVAFGALAAARPSLVAVALGHLHNLVAVGFFLALAGRHLGVWGAGAILASFFVPYGLLVGGALGAGGAAASSGALGPGGAAASFAGLDLAGLTATLAPGCAPEVGHALVLSFAFGQAVHYSVWCHLLEATRAPPGPPRTLHQRLAGWREDLGEAGWLPALLGVVALPAMGLLDPAGTRAAYLSLVLFHGWLELSLATYLFSAGMDPREWTP